jgi:hypothetical protein
MKSSRLSEFMEKMEPSSVAIFASAHDIRRNADTDFEFRQETDFYYLTRLNEPDCVAIIPSTSMSFSSGRASARRRSGRASARASRARSSITAPTRHTRSASSTNCCPAIFKTSKSSTTGSETTKASMPGSSRPSNIFVRRSAAASTPRRPSSIRERSFTRCVCVRAKRTWRTCVGPRRSALRATSRR